MIDNAVEEKVLNMLRESALKGSNREISVDAPMGELGLDSLALVQFVTALERSFDVELPEAIWTDKNQLTLRNFSRLIYQSQKSDSTSRKKDENPANAEETPKTRFEKVRSAIRRSGLWQGIIWSLSHLLYRSERRHLLSFDLTREIPEYTPARHLTFTIATTDDFPFINELYEEPLSNKEFIRRLHSGYLCFLAWHENKIVACDWIASRDHFDPITRLNFKMGSNTCYGLELREDKNFEGKGVGLALLTFSLRESKRRGFEKSITWVDSHNTKMLSASVHILGHKKIGQIITTKILFIPFTTWHINNHSGVAIEP